MKCPVCSDVRMREVEKDGILIDVCPDCKGVWLDRGELDKLMASVREFRKDYEDDKRYDERRTDGKRYDDEKRYDDDDKRSDHSSHGSHGYPKHKKKKSVFDVFEDLF